MMFPMIWFAFPLVNLYFHNFADPKIYEYDTLGNVDRWDDDFDCILTNPPFMTPKGGVKPHKKFSIQAKRSEVLFVDYIMEHLTPNGKAGIIVPEGIIFQSDTAYKALRKMMIDQNFLLGWYPYLQESFNPMQESRPVSCCWTGFSQKRQRTFYSSKLRMTVLTWAHREG